jgi:hypothetical protein
VLRKVEADLHAAFPDVHFKLTPRWFKSGRSFSVGRADLLTRMLERRSRSLSPAAIRARRSRALRRDCVVILRVRAPAGVG